MKSLLIFLILTIINQLNSQDFSPAQKKFSFEGQQLYLNPEMEYFKPTGIIRGWHWGASRKISQALNSNQKYATRFLPTTELIDTCNIMLLAGGYTHGVGPEIMNARSFNYEPTLSINPQYPEQLTYRNGDTTNPIFGFKSRRGRVLTDVTDINFNRIIIEGDSLINQEILANQWPDNRIYMKGYNENKIDSVRNKYLCKQLYLTINLRKPNIDSTTLPILKIECQYTKGNGIQGLLYFDSIPSPVSEDTFSIANQRGCYRKLIDTTYQRPNYFYITEKMLPPNEKDITISGFINFDDNVNINPLLKEDLLSNTNRIDKINIKITYLGNNSVYIDWVKLETPHARELFQGKYDSSLALYVQQDINHYTTSQFKNYRKNIYRYTTVVEGELYHWGAERYYNKLIGKITSNSLGNIYPELYEYYVQPPDRWIQFHKTMAHIAAPYTKYSSTMSNTEFITKTLGCINGYMGYKRESESNQSGIQESNEGASHYLTYLARDNDILANNHFITNPNDVTAYKKVISTSDNNWRASWLADYERAVNETFIDNSNSYLLFSDKPWYCQSFIDINLINADYNNRTYSIFHKRPISGEEFKAVSYLPIILGAKGILYDGAESDTNSSSKIGTYNGNAINEEQKNAVELLEDKLFLSTDIAGRDFIQESNEIFNLNSRIQDLSNISTTMDRPSDKIYIGRKTLRWELRKIFTWIKSVEDELLQLRLQAYLSKGFKQHYFQDKHWEDFNVLRSYINIDSIKTRQIGCTQYEGKPEHNYKDSSYFDLTILNNNNVPMSQKLYIGILNRRTNPLLLENDKLIFYTTNEIDSFALHGGSSNDGIYHNPDYWQNKYWQRLGCREITIPIKIQNLQENEIIKVTELGVDNPNYNNPDTNFWMDKRLRHTIDTTFYKDSNNLIIRLLPGEGKIIRITTVTAPKFEGNLDYANQRKIVAYPVDDNSLSNEHLNLVRYHATYYKQEIDEWGDPMPAEVYYRRSFPMGKTTPTEAIKWEQQEYKLSDNINQYFPEGSHNTLQYESCKYPSIVVRLDSVSNQLKAYVVYACTSLLTTHPDTNKVYITESIIANVNSNQIQAPEAKVIAVANEKWALDLDYGYPVVNASRNGNYYAWSDSLKGIKAGFKGADQDQFTTNNVISISFYNHPDTVFCNHPAMNTYSRIANGEDDCALVWQETEKPKIYSQNDIFYTRLRMNNNSLMNYFNTQHCDPCEYLDNLSNQDNTIICLTRDVYNVKNSVENMLPTIYRSTSRFDGTSSHLMMHRDEVFWQGKLIDTNSSREILNSFIQHVDHPANGTFEPECSVINGINSIGEYGYYNYTPNVTQGLLKRYYSGESYTDSAIVMNFQCLHVDSVPSSSYYKIWHVALPHNMIFNDSIKYPTMSHSTIARKFPEGTSNPNLAALPFINEYNDYKLNRRLFNKGNDIISTLHYFHKENINQNYHIYLYGFRHNNKISYITFPRLYDNNNNIINYNVSLMEENDSLIIPKDTIISDWFQLGSVSNIKFLSKGMKQKKLKLALQRQSDNKIFNINIVIDQDSIVKSNKLKLLNGNCNSFRIVISKNNEDSHPVAQIILNGSKMFDENQDSLQLGKTNQEEEFIDLAEGEIKEGEEIGLSVSPNPADKEFYVSLYSEKGMKIDVHLFDMQGNVVYTRTNISAGANHFPVDVSSLPSGVYNLKAQTGVHFKTLKIAIVK